MGFVLPIAINKYTAVVGAKSVNNDIFTLVVPNYENPGEAPLVKTWERKDFFTNTKPVKWHHYIRGVCALIQERGIEVPGFCAAVVGNVPQGGGLSSSAALEVSTATFVERLCNTKIDPVEKAILCQKVEHIWCDVPCGVMDQFASVFGKENHAILIDCKTNIHKEILMDSKTISILIINSNVKHALVDSAYKKRKANCDSSVKKLNITSLREITPVALEEQAKAANLTPVELKRSRHVVNEIARTEEAANALQKGDYVKMGKLMNESHESLRILYEVSCKELDILVDAAKECKGVYGARMTGAGFGGSIVVLVDTTLKSEIEAFVSKAYTEKTGITASFISSPPSQGAMIEVLELQ
ncbi:hypothetical protein AAMO2058_000869700 [Amorphochlora amoebiformis]|mmetsp:Transcript_5520/g.8416  ORF Transcript_5520/g.8416 Transcript_5520/m.8416 type:complete len:357 (-) Transcript_5520:185-1255(-)